MSQITQEQRDALQAAGWTEVEATTFAQTLATFRDGLPPRQRDAFTEILAAGDAAQGDVQGYLVVNAIIGILLPMMLPSRESRSASGTATAPGSGPR